MNLSARPSRLARIAGLLAVAALALGPAPAAPAASFTDELGRAVQAPERPGRIIALTPALTETLFALGLGDKVVGVTAWSDYPPQAKGLPQIGSYVAPNLERILELAPQLVLASRDGNPPELIAQLSGLGVAVYVVAPDDPLALPATLEALGRVCGAPQAGRRLAEGLRRDYAAVAARLAGVQPRPTLMVIGSSPLITAGEGSLTNRLLVMAGGHNIAQGLPGRWPTLSLEKVVEAQPEVVVLSTMERGMDRDRVMAYWRNLPGLAERPGLRVVYIDSDIIDRAGPRLGQGLMALARLIHPERFAEDRR